MQARAEILWRPDRRTMIAGLLLLAGAAAITVFPMHTAVLCVGIWALSLLVALPRRLALFIPFLFLVSFPADHIAGLNEGAHGFFVLGATTLLVLVSALRNAKLRDVLADWDLLGLACLLTATSLLHSQSGEIRGVLFWMSACLALYWLRAEERRCPGPAVQIENALIAAGALGGVLAILERTGAFHVSELVSLYQPATLDLGVGNGQRAVALSGHPLRLGSLTMLSSLIGLARITHRDGDTRHRAATLAAIGLSLAGLALSGARGSWLGFAVGCVLVVVLGDRSRLTRRIFAGTAITVAVITVGWLTGAWEFFYARVIGTTSHPASLEQRLLVLDAVRQVWSQIPVFGLGFGGASDKVMAMGLRALNIENEYLRFFLAAGWLGPLSILVIGWRRIRSALDHGRSLRSVVAITALGALFVNMASFNLFAWSFGPAVLFAVAVLAMPRIGGAE
jgi:hypothetical protein